MEYAIGAAALAASLLTLFSGFGLGTLLLPVFSIFFPVHVSVALTGIVHLANNLFKLGLVGRYGKRDLIGRFGLPSVAGGILGALLLSRLSDIPVWYRWYWGERLCEVTPLKLTMAALMLFFAAFELVPVLKKYSFPRSFLLPGGFVSGFFGGLSGHQGALRSAFLVRFQLEKEVFIGTGVAIACMTDMVRIPVYMERFGASEAIKAWPVLLIAIVCAFAGAYLGTRYMRKVTLPFVQYCTAILIMVIALLLGTGIL